MPLIVEDGTGKATADAYVSLAEADAYFLGRNTAWGALANDAKESAIRFATSWIDDTYAALWKGARANELQTLAWPRDNSPGRGIMLWRGSYPRVQGYIYDLDGFPIDPDVVPKAVKRACMEAAILQTQNFDFAAGTSTASIKSTSQSVDRVSFSEAYEVAVTQRALQIQAIDRLLIGLVTSTPGAGFGTVKLVRA